MAVLLTMALAFGSLNPQKMTYSGSTFNNSLALLENSPCLIATTLRQYLLLAISSITNRLRIVVVYVAKEHQS